MSDVQTRSNGQDARLIEKSKLQNRVQSAWALRLERVEGDLLSSFAPFDY